MPLTAFSRRFEEELDVGQLLRRLSQAEGGRDGLELEAIPDSWRRIVSQDMECPSCFTLGAELVREGVSTQGARRVVRQACFRYPTHRAQCDFARPDASGVAIPDNLVSFGSPKTALTRAIGRLVGAGIQEGVISQRKIRDMREWFFLEKSAKSFTVTLDPQIPLWLARLRHQCGWVLGEAPITLTHDLAALPGFDWRAAARRMYAAQHAGVIEVMRTAGFGHGISEQRVSLLARKHHGEEVFDPAPLRQHYKLTIDLSRFIAQNYDPIGRNSKRGEEPHTAALALSALLLFLSEWNMDAAAAVFGRIAKRAPSADENLGNVIGMNPWHDYLSWQLIRNLQALNLSMPEGGLSPQEDVDVIEAALRQKFQGHA